VSSEKKKKYNFSCAVDFYRETYDDDYIFRPLASLYNTYPLASSYNEIFGEFVNI
jgi:hypothetical protein